MKIALIFVPQWTAAQPHYSMSLLAGQLRHAGHQMKLFDLNLSFYDHVLHPTTARFSHQRALLAQELALNEAQLRLAVADHSAAAAVAAKKQSVLATALAATEDPMAGNQATFERWSQAPECLRRAESFYKAERFVAATGAIDEALAHFSLPFFPAAIGWNCFSHPTVPLNLGPMVEFCRDPLANPFFDFFARQLDPILSCGAECLALSISAFSQVLPGLTLAMLLKEQRDREALPIHISLGGNFFSRLAEPLKKSPLFFMLFCDSLTIGEGEVPLVQLAAALAERPREQSALRRVSSLLFVDENSGEVVATPEAPAPDIEALAFLDLSGFPLQRYHSPEPVVCIRASKGCYWGKCLFCDSHHGLRAAKMSVERLIAELRHLQQEFGVRHFEFVDQCIAPDLMHAMCDAMIAADLDIRWFANVRTDPGFTPELFAKIKRAGGTKLMWGIESGSPRLLELMHKGIDPNQRLAQLRAAADAGLWNFAYIFFGFPSETQAEAETTIDLLVDHTAIIHSYGRSIFTLGKHSPLLGRLREFGIEEFSEDEQELSTNLTYRAPGSLSQKELRTIAERCTSRARQAYGDPLWMLLRSRENLHLYLAHHGRDHVRDFKLAGPITTGADNFVF